MEDQEGKDRIVDCQLFGPQFIKEFCNDYSKDEILWDTTKIWNSNMFRKTEKWREFPVDCKISNFIWLLQRDLALIAIL